MIRSSEKRLGQWRDFKQFLFDYLNLAPRRLKLAISGRFGNHLIVREVANKVCHILHFFDAEVSLVKYITVRLYVSIESGNQGLAKS